MLPLLPRDLDARFITALKAEFFGTLIFQFLGGMSGSYWGNGLSLAVTGAISAILGCISGLRQHPDVTLQFGLSAASTRCQISVPTARLRSVRHAGPDRQPRQEVTWYWYRVSNRHLVLGGSTIGF